MSKCYIPFEFYKQLCLSVAEQLESEKLDEVVAVHRGGMVAASIIGKHLRLPVGSYFPKTSSLNLVNDKATRIAFIEDLVAEGRTLSNVESFVKSSKLRFDCVHFVPLLVDGNFKQEFKFYGIKTNHWVVMPWEDFELMQEGDRGLFRNGTDSYAK